MSEFPKTKNQHEHQLKLAYSLIQGIDKQNYEYIYCGKFSNSITNNLLSLAQTFLERSEDTSKLKKKIYFVMVECLQNITKHQDVNGEMDDDSGILVLQKQNQKYYITTGNIIKNKNIDNLKLMLNKVNSLTTDELKKYYQEVLITGEISDKGGAGLGLIAMARKTASKLLFDFQEVNDQFSYFYLRTEIPLSGKTEETELDKWKYSFEKIKRLHKTLLRENILLNFNGAFDQDNLINLLSIIDAQVQGSLDFKKRIFKIMFEMLHNIVQYSEDIYNETSKVGENEGIFLLGAAGNSLSFTAGNYLHNNKIDTLKEKLDFVNTLSDTELRDFYEKVSSYFESNEINKPDLSIIEMKLISNNPLNYLFDKVSDHYSFFTLQTSIIN
ncbi:MAG: SiaB family protein kinase [Bacteroidales bacterium]|nr:SiaB family protein kinase [Bacteroidales bacterium]